MAKTSMAAFNVAKKANSGSKMMLTLPDGTETEEYLVVMGADSTKFRGVVAKANREKLKKLKSMQDNDAARDKMLLDTEIKVLASLVVDWSFDEECTQANVVRFFKDSPQIQEQVDSFASDRANFFEVPRGK